MQCVSYTKKALCGDWSEEPGRSSELRKAISFRIFPRPQITTHCWYWHGFNKPRFICLQMRCWLQRYGHQRCPSWQAEISKRILPWWDRVHNTCFTRNGPCIPQWLFGTKDSEDLQPSQLLRQKRCYADAFEIVCAFLDYQSVFT